MGRRIEPFTAEMELIDAASDGRSVARHDGRVVFVEGGVPGDVADVHVFRKQKGSLVGRIETLKTPSPKRVEAACPHFGVCGGCKWQNMAYESQIAYKDDQVRNILQRIGHVEVGEFHSILGVEDPFFYRNKLEFSFSTKAWITDDTPEAIRNDQRVLGYHTPRIFDKIIDIDTCLLQKPIINDIRNAIREFAKAEHIDFYDIREHEGFLRNVMFRTSEGTGELMLTLIVAKHDPKTVGQIFTFLADKFPQITQFVWIVNEKVNSSFSDLPYEVWRGQPFLTEHLGGYKFRIRPTSFFQTNPKQAERLYGVVKKFAEKSLPEGQARFQTLYDLYSGTGSIGIFVSELVEKIVGIEYVDSAVKDAWENVRANELDEGRFSFYAGDMKKLLTPELREKEGNPDLIITDPPRAGMDGKVVKRVLELNAPYIIYVSCKPSTQARDLQLMAEHYEVLESQAVDMFPHTAHVENVVWLKRKG